MNDGMGNSVCLTNPEEVIFREFPQRDARGAAVPERHQVREAPVPGDRPGLRRGLDRGRLRGLGARGEHFQRQRRVSADKVFQISAKKPEL